MTISIIEPIVSTKIVIVIFIAVLLASLRPKKSGGIFPLELTQELKGLSILAVIFSHVGYFLSNDQRFLFPLSIMAGIGVNLFLFLSGYGLAISLIKKKLPPLKFYQRRFVKLMIPFWLVTSIFFIADRFLLHIDYSWPYIIKSLLGYFPRADLYLDINSPFWFITPIIFYYFIFPFIFFPRRPWVSAIFIYFISRFILCSDLPVSEGVFNMYQAHYLAFPIGVACASLFFQPYYERIKDFLLKISIKASGKIAVLRPIWQTAKRPAYNIAMGVLLFYIGYFAYYSGVGRGVAIEQRISILVVGLMIIFFIMKKFEIRLFYLFGIYSYEIYLVHWPLMSRYDLFYKYLPGWAALIAYLFVFLAAGWFLQSLTGRFAELKIFRKKYSEKEKSLA